MEEMVVMEEIIIIIDVEIMIIVIIMEEIQEIEDIIIIVLDHIIIHHEDQNDIKENYHIHHDQDLPRDQKVDHIQEVNHDQDHHLIQMILIKEEEDIEDIEEEVCFFFVLCLFVFEKKTQIRKKLKLKLKKKKKKKKDNYRRHRHHRGRDNGMNRSRYNQSNRNRDDMNNNNNNNNNHGMNNDNHNNNHNMNNNGRNMHRGNRSNMKSNGNTNEKVPVSFKEFTNQMLEDDVTASEAQKRYEKYLQRFSKSDDVLFFEAHKDEEWFQERYDPIIIEKSIESRRQNARSHYWKFYEQFLNDALPDIHDNIKDFQQIPNTIKPSTPIDDDGNVDDNNNDKEEEETGNIKEEKKPQDTQTTTTTMTTTTTTTMTTITTTTIGGNNDDNNDGMDVDNEEDNNNNNINIDRIIPDDGKLRLPKYADFMYKDDYEPQLRESSPFDSNRYHNRGNTTDRNECYQNSIFIQGIPLHIQRDKILIPFKKFEGFEKLILSDPIRNSRKVRYGWVTFNNQENCRKALQDVASGGLNGHQLTGQYFMNLLPKQKSKRRPKFSPPESLYPHRVLFDIKQTKKLCIKFDEEAGIKNNPLLRDDLLSKLSEIRKLNLLLLYLRKIHFLCYYCGKHFLSEEHMFARCSGTHERKVPADISLAMSGNIDIDHSNTENQGNIVKKDKTSWEKDLDQRINDVINYIIDHKRCWIERKQLKMLEKNTKKISEGKFRCTICSKLFKAEIYVIKHIKNKHQDEIAKYIADQRLRTMFENYRRDRDRLTIRSFEDNDDNNKSSNKTNSSSSHSHNNKMMNLSTDKRGGNNGRGGPNITATAPNAHHQQLLLTHPASIQLHAPPHHHAHTAAPLMLPPYAHGIPPPHAAPYPYPSPHVANTQLVTPHPHAATATFPPPSTTTAAPTVPTVSTQQNATNATAATTTTDASKTTPTPGSAPSGMHPERAAMTAGGLPPTQTTEHHGRRGGGRNYSPHHHHGMHDPSIYQDQYGRKLPIHYQEPASRTRRSYREVDIEFPADEVEEEIDYGFGDFVKNPTKFNL